MKKKLAIKFLIENLQGESSLKNIKAELAKSGNDTQELKKNLLTQIETAQTIKKHESIHTRKLELENDILNFQAIKAGPSYSYQNTLQYGFHKKNGNAPVLEDCDEEFFLLSEQTKRLKGKRGIQKK